MALAKVLFLIGCGTRIATAQTAVTATSGDPKVIAGIRAVFDRTERDTARFRRVSQQLFNFSLQGGEVTGYFDGDSLRKMTARHYGESGRWTDEYFFANGRLAFVHELGEHYDAPLSGRAVERVEYRWYFDNGRLIRRIRTQSPARFKEDWEGRERTAEHVMEMAQRLAACVAAKGVKPAACTAPDPK